jgi:hypothetical protein
MTRRDRKHVVGGNPSPSKHDCLNSPSLKLYWTKIWQWNETIGWTPTRSKPESTEIGHWNYMIGSTPSPSKPDWLNFQPLETWLDKTGIPKLLDWLNSEPLEIWLAKLWAPQNLSDWIPRSRNLTYWTPSLKKSDWARPECQTHLIGRRCCILLSALFFDLRFLMFYWPLIFTQRCFFDFWSVMFFWPLSRRKHTNKQTNKRILFHMTLPTVEGITELYKDSSSDWFILVQVEDGPIIKKWSSKKTSFDKIVNIYYLNNCSTDKYSYHLFISLPKKSS